ncbi:perosamine synthetase [Symbiobacterium terraclitae]|uniref:Perosamine synthetase n=1 Tax=Symbiobacterium terraclitae TaxID=557451 RepID=A0ABS4JWE5_9FIRM|nr:DegT/DnrJ/EryC1/StrS family aminotransferase [Symbiobacterium terraclitae]MBP2019862.1 perosamine synthetase [Symbiobacterium terraclitae]
MRIPLARPDLGPQEEEAVIAVLRSGVLSMGPWIERFEAAVAARAGARHAVACSSGTAGLHLLLTACGIGPGDEVITPSFSFVASANAVVYTDARPVFADIDPVTLCMDPDHASTLIGPRTRAVLPVDVFGHPAPMPELRELADRHGLLLIEDACEALGSSLHGVPCGSPRWAHGALFAFYPNKQITTGEGGVVVTDDDRLAALCRSLRNQGRGEDGAWLTHVRLGYNYRMDEMSAAVGAVQMARLEELLAKRDRVAEAYRRRLAGIPGVAVPEAAPGAEVQWFVWVVRLDPAIDRDRVMQALLDRGIGCRPYFSPIHLQPFYMADFGCRPGDLPVTEAVARSVLALPFHAGLTEAEIDEVAEALAEAVARAGAVGSGR